MKKSFLRKSLSFSIFLIVLSGGFSVTSLNVSNNISYANTSFSSVVIYKTVGNPNMTGLGGSPDWWATSNTPIWIDAEAFGSNLSSVMYKVNSGSWVNIPLNEMPKDVYLSGNCVHDLYIKASDDDGNTVYDNETFYIDNMVPGAYYQIFDPWGLHPSGAFLITEDSAYLWGAIEQGVSPCIVGYLDIYYNYW